MPADDTDITWSALDSSMDNIQQGSTEFHAGQTREEPGERIELHEELPPTLGAGGRSETINSHTAYASLSEIQPRNTYNYTGITVADLENNSFVQQQTQGQGEITLEDVEAVTGVKRQHEEEAERVNQCKVIIVDSSGNTTEEYTTTEDAFSDPFEVQIPLGGSAETEASEARLSSSAGT